MSNTDKTPNNDNDIDHEDEKKKSINDITKELIDQLKDSSSDLFMTLPPDEVIEDTQQKNNNKDMIEHIRSFNIKPKEVKTYLDRFIINQMDAKSTCNCHL